MNVANFPNYYNIQRSAPASQLVTMLNEKAADSPLEAAQQALLDAKLKLDQHRDEQIEEALDGYRSLRSRQTSYESELSGQRKRLEDFQALSGRCGALSEELASARAGCEACAGDADPSALPQDLGPARRVSELEDQLAAASRDLSALVEQANRYARGQRQYANYLEKTGQGGYAAFEYQSQPEFTLENFTAEASGMIDRLEAGASQWRERVFSYCEQYGLTPNDFESYLQERRKLSDACFAAQQRVSELLYAAQDPASAGDAPAQSAQPDRNHFDTLELSGVQPPETLPPAGAENEPDAAD